jgi:hypothetical protein
MYELMVTVSVVVDDTDAAVETLCSRLGVPEPRPQAYAQGQGIRAVFCRVHPKYAVAPTFLEVVSAAPITEAGPDVPVFPVEKVAALQGDRPVKIHATEIGMPYQTLMDLGDHLQRLGVPHRFTPGPATRLFTGSESLVSYDPTADAGLFIEGCPSADLQLAEEAFTAPADIPEDAHPSTMVRIAAREYLVEDLDETLRIMKRNLRWEPSVLRKEEGCRRAVMPFSVARSAALEFVEPTGRGRVSEAFDEVGPGAWTIRVAVVDVDAKAEDLAARDTQFTMEAGVLRPDPAATLGVPFEFTTAASSA